MPRQSLFISDLHLRKDRPETTNRFLSFLENRACKVEALYILGDLFDIWIGDDDPTTPNREIVKQLRAVTNSGTRVFFQQGNRDFLIGRRFADETGTRILEDYAVIDLYGVPTLLMHGDLLCTDDHAYQTFRKKVRSPAWQAKMLAKPLFARLMIARWYQFRTRRDKNKKPLNIMDVNSEFVVKTLIKFGVNRLIHGHTHRPNIHEFEINGKPARRFVLPEWDDKGGVLCWDRSGFRIESVD